MRAIVVMLVIWVAITIIFSWIGLRGCAQLADKIRTDGLKTIIETIWEGEQ